MEATSWKTWNRDDENGEAPLLDSVDMTKLLADFYGIQPVALRKMDGLVDASINVITDKGEAFTFKITRNPLITSEQHEAHLAFMGYLLAEGFSVPKVLPTVDCKLYAKAEFIDEKDGPLERMFHLQTFIPGKMLIGHMTEELCFKAGELLGAVDKSLINFNHTFYDGRDDSNILIQIYGIDINNLITFLPEEKQQETCRAYIKAYEERVTAWKADLPIQPIHFDLHNRNIIINEEGTNIAGFIDFAEHRKSLRVLDPSIFLAAVLVHKGIDTIKCSEMFLKGYGKHIQLSKAERHALPATIAGRMVLVHTVNNWLKTMFPEYNAKYLESAFATDYAWEVLEEIVYNKGNAGQFLESYESADY